ncbi:MAG: hypothetical protein LCH56_03420 [Proteobacteria bacterium]|nr:hypothetical protein [Pseudomonadota bacterium]
MAKYPKQTCRDCGNAEWVWSTNTYAEGKRRIIVQQPGYCLAEKSAANDGSGLKPAIDAQHPFERCAAWAARPQSD